MEPTYVGSTEDVAERVKRHNAADDAEWTARRRPVALVYSESQPDEASAIQRERPIKRWSRAEKEARSLAVAKNTIRKIAGGEWGRGSPRKWG